MHFSARSTLRHGTPVIATRLATAPSERGQKSIRRRQKRCGYDTFLTSCNRAANRQALLRSVSAVFCAVFFEYIYIIDIQLYTMTYKTFILMKRQETWLSALQDSQSCVPTLTILPRKQVKVRGQNSQSRRLTLTILDDEAV